MSKSLTPDNFPDDSAFDRVVEHIVPMDHFPVRHNGVDFMLTPANAALRMFFGDGEKDFSHVVIYLDDGTAGGLKLEDKYMHAMALGGFPVELPDSPNEADRELLDTYRAWELDD